MRVEKIHRPDKKRGRTSKTKASGQGFQRLKPITGCFEYDDSGPAKRKTRHYKALVEKHGPYAFFITLTVDRKMSGRALMSYTGELIKRFSKKLFGRKQNTIDSVKGFAFIEDHKSAFSANDIHVHMLIKRNDRYEKFSRSDLKDIFSVATSKIVSTKGRPVFNPNGLDFQLADNDGVIGYCFKNINDSNLDRFKIISKDGLSDDLL